MSTCLLIAAALLAAEAGPAGDRAPAAINGETRDTVLLLPGGPLHLRLHVGMGGRSLAAVRKQLAQQLLTTLDEDGDGRLNRHEAARSPLLRTKQREGARQFLQSIGDVPVTRVSIACAGVAVGDTLVNANLPWAVSLAEIRSEIGVAEVALVNDFEAVACATHYLRASECVLLPGDAEAAAQGPTLIVGPGTGLGAAVRIPGRNRSIVLATEAAHPSYREKISSRASRSTAASSNNSSSWRWDSSCRRTSSNSNQMEFPSWLHPSERRSSSRDTISSGGAILAAEVVTVTLALRPISSTRTVWGTSFS